MYIFRTFFSGRTFANICEHFLEFPKPKNIYTSIQFIIPFVSLIMKFTGRLPPSDGRDAGAARALSRQQDSRAGRPPGWAGDPAPGVLIPGTADSREGRGGFDATNQPTSNVSAVMNFPFASKPFRSTSFFLLHILLSRVYFSFVRILSYPTCACLIVFDFGDLSGCVENLLARSLPPEPLNLVFLFEITDGPARGRKIPWENRRKNSDSKSDEISRPCCTNLENITEHFAFAKICKIYEQLHFLSLERCNNVSIV